MKLANKKVFNFSFYDTARDKMNEFSVLRRNLTIIHKKISRVTPTASLKSFIFPQRTTTTIKSAHRKAIKIDRQSEEKKK